MAIAIESREGRTRGYRDAAVRGSATMRRSILPRHLTAAGALVPALVLSVTAAFAWTNGNAGLAGADQGCAFVKLVVDPSM